ncbi:FG-GAP repeat protein, partial [Zoogloea sp.]|uniref:FG-GAP repeat protein n=1 Tax=Zoogloea sp. TaxID=49181 RepID=UPI0032201086
MHVVMVASAISLSCGISSATAATLTASDGQPSDFFGVSIAQLQDTIFVGSSSDDVAGLPNAGSVYVFERVGGVYSQTQRLNASDIQQNANFGIAISAGSGLLVVGAPNASPGGMNLAGSAYVFERVDGLWREAARLQPNAGDLAAGDRLGSAVSISGGTIYVGAPGDRVGANDFQGSVYVFGNSGLSWQREARVSSLDGMPNEYFGVGVVGLDANAFIAGSPGMALGSLGSVGRVSLYGRAGGVWSRQATITPSGPAANMFFGNPLAAEGGSLVVSASNSPFRGTV